MNKQTIAAIIAGALLSEGMEETGCLKLNKFQALALDLGGENFSAENGVGYVEITGPESAQQFLMALDADDCVEAYDVSVDGEESEEEIDDVLGYPEETVFGITFYLVEDAVMYDAVEVDAEEIKESKEDKKAKSDESDDGEKDDGEKEDAPEPKVVDDEGIELDEVKKRITMNHKGVKKVKMQCPRGFKYSPAEHACVKIGGDQLAKQRKASVKAVMSRKAGGKALAARAALRTKKAMNFRKAAGLSK